MFGNLIRLGLTCSVAMAMFASCEHQDFTNTYEDVDRVQVNHISDEMAKVRDYVPRMAVIAHRGSTFWTPEETEAAYRWAREMGADYLEADLQCSKDGVVLALHDDNLSRTTDIEDVYGESFPTEVRRAFYKKHYKMTDAQADAQIEKDKAAFVPYYAKSYMYEELLALDAGTWFNDASPEQGRTGFSARGGVHQYISALADLINYAKGKKLDRENGTGERIYTITKTGDPNSYTEGDKLVYTFSYVNDDVDSGNRPGIYIEFKESWLNPTTFEKDVYQELAKYDYNIIEKPSTETAFYKDGKVNVGNTNGRVILQTFSLESLRRTGDVFQGKIPMCFLFWEGTAATDLIYDTPSGYASFINLGLQHKAHIIGPSIAGAPNNYPEMNAPWQAYLIKKSGMLNHPYSFDSREQMGKYFGEYNWGNEGGSLFEPPYLDGAFTNRTELTLQYFIDKGVRNKDAVQTVPDPRQLLDKLGYVK
ncbi:putative uncharacterized protein [Bacteroides sp. CAG:462]|nr:putative uncharacterized protein [Bacteroides sp. CAG:462]